MMVRMDVVQVETPIGWFRAAADGGVVREARFVEAAGWRRDDEQLADVLTEYFGGDVDAIAAVRVDARGTTFQQRGLGRPAPDTRGRDGVLRGHRSRDRATRRVARGGDRERIQSGQRDRAVPPRRAGRRFDRRLRRWRRTQALAPRPRVHTQLPRRRRRGNDAVMERRDFLKAGLVLGGAAALGGCRLFPIPPSPGARTHSIIDGAPGDSGIDTIVICMMENRSFDSYLGWLARDDKYLETRSQAVRRDVHGQRRLVPDVSRTRTGNRSTRTGVSCTRSRSPWRGCDFPDPGHGWDEGRAERDGGFLAPGSGNDVFALGYFEGEDLPFYDALARRFPVFDDWHASVLGPTYPNREYLLSAQSGGNKSNDLPDSADGVPVGRRSSTGSRRRACPSRDYYSDLPPLALLGARAWLRSSAPIDRLLRRRRSREAAQRHVRRPGFVGDDRTDDHPHGDPRAAADVRARRVRGVRAVAAVGARAVRAHLRRVGRLLRPRRAAAASRTTARARTTPTTSARPASGSRRSSRRRARCRAPSTTRTYDHTSILRFLEWRFLGAPPRGSSISARWSLTKRDRLLANPGELLARSTSTPTSTSIPTSDPRPDGRCGAPAPSAQASAAEEPSPWEPASRTATGRVSA